MAQATGRIRPNNFPMDDLLKMTFTLAASFRNPADEESGRPLLDVTPRLQTLLRRVKRVKNREAPQFNRGLALR
jgi:hypothetical protein